MAIVFLRTVLLYAVIVCALRLMGKRQLAQLQPSEFVVTILVSNIATLPLQDTDIPLIGGIIPILCLVSFEILISYLSRTHHKLHKLFSGSEKVLIENGIIHQDTMRELRYSGDDLMSELRANSIYDLRDVAFAIVQTNGTLNVYPKFSAQPVTAEMLNLTSDNPDAVPFLIASEGATRPEGLAHLGLNEAWLKKLLAAKGKGVKDVFMMTAAGADDYYIVWRQDAVVKNKQ